MSHWLLDKLDETRKQALHQASRIQVYRNFLNEPLSENIEFIRRTAEALELVVLDLLRESEKKLNELRRCAFDAFRLFRVLPLPEDSLKAAMFMLRASSLAVLGDRGTDAARWLRESEWPELPLNSTNWRDRTWATILDIWLRLIRMIAIYLSCDIAGLPEREKGWKDCDLILKRVASLRDSQKEFEQKYLHEQEPAHAKHAAMELIALYHLAKAAELLALYITDGVVDGKYQIHHLLEIHFDRVLAVCKHVRVLELEPMSRLLFACALQMADNSIWAVIRAVNARVT